MWVRIIIGGAFLFAWSAAAPAAWHKASSPHFIIYADEKPEKLRAYAAKLEKFDQAVRFARRMEDYPVGDGNRVTIFVTRSTNAVQKLANDKSGTVAGFYIPRAEGPLAFVPRTTGDEDMSADVVFFHEYAHHLMLQELERPYPEWLIEGFAEFMSTATFEKDGRVALGRAAQHRALGLLYTEGMPLETLLAGSYDRINEIQRESVYGKGWLLTHYLTFENSRAGQLDKYVTAIGKGVPPLDAARQAFGDLRQLGQDLDKYLKRRTILTLFIGAGIFRPVSIDIQPLSAGAAEVMPLRMESKRGVTQTTAEPLAAKVRRVQASFPGDPLVEVTLAEAELDSGHPEASEAAADRALAADPRNIEAMIFKGRAIIARALAKQSEGSSVFDEARSWFLRANKLDTEDPEPLMEFYRSYVEQGVAPTKNAIEALHYASNLVPQDTGLRLNSAVRYLRDKDLKKARETLAPIAFDPHGREMAAVARTMITRIDAGDAAGAQKVAEDDEMNASNSVGAPAH
jgi:Flp pilus assembly protein TadD